MNEKDTYFAWMLFLIWPFLAAASAVANFHRPWAKNIVWAFVAFYGFTFAIGAESERSDIVRYVAQYQELHLQDMTVDTAKRYYQESGEIDFARTVIAIGLSRISDSQPLLTFVYAIIFGFFFSRNMWYVLERLEGRLQWLTILLVACFFLIIPIWNINGFRMWTAAHIFMYGMLPFLFEGKKDRLLVSGLSILFHFSFILPFFVLVFIAFFPGFLNIYFGFFAATIFLNEIELTVLNQWIETYAPEAFQDRTSAYRVEAQPGETVISDIRERRWYAVWYLRAISYTVIGFLIIMFVTGREYIKERKEWLNLFSFTLAFYGVANLMGSFSSSGRFIVLANFFALPLIILYIQNIPSQNILKKYALIALPAIVLFLVVALRIGLYSLSATSILGNPIVAYFTFEEYMSLNDFLRRII